MSRYLLTFVILLAGNLYHPVSAQAAKRFDILITEISPDPTPVITLPPFEFLELTNVSTTSYNLKDWKISDGSSSTGIGGNFILYPDSIVIICSNPSLPLFSAFGKAIGISSFPSLDNDEDLIVLRSPEGSVIHAVNYTRQFYQNDVKSDGGWSLEMIDTKSPCMDESNWKASESLTGGSPGKKNSVAGDNKDEIIPRLIRTFSKDSLTLQAVFNEQLDSTSAADASKYVLDKINPLTATPVGPLFTEVRLTFPTPLRQGVVYKLAVSKVTDCAGNEVDHQNFVNAGLPKGVDLNDIIINEILFNPKTDGFDFFELYNRSEKIVDLQTLYAASRTSTGTLTNITSLSHGSLLMYPGDFIVFTRDSRWLKQNYTVKPVATVLQLLSFPSLPDDQGTLVIAAINGNAIDELQYDSRWHFGLIDDDEGISLERIDYNAPSQNKENWTSAASSAGFATPGYQNSQFRTDKQLQGLITIDPRVFSPDNNGVDDFATITYQMTQPGYVANIIIFDSQGRIMRHLARNATLALQGYFRWDGLDDTGQKLPTGIYVIFTEVFNLQGKTKRFKNAVTLARKL